MGLFNIAEILSGTAQYAGVLSSLDVKWPNSLEWLRQELRILRMDFSYAIPAFKIKSIDVRAQHILLTTILPFFVAIMLLILFKPVSIVMWYCTTLISIGLLFTGGFLRLMASDKFQDQRTSAEYFIYAGLGGLGACLLLYGLRIIIISRRQKRSAISPVDDIVANSNDEITPEIAARATFDKKRKSFWTLLRNFVVSILLIFFGLLITGLVKDDFLTSWFYFYGSVKSILSLFVPLVGWVMILVGAIMFLDWFCELFNKTRRISLQISYIIRKNAIKIILSIMMLLYIPITGSIWNIMYCTHEAIESGNEFVRDNLYNSFESVLAKFTAVHNKNVASVSCNFMTNACPIAASLCPADSDWRLVKDKSISCGNEIFYYYYAGALLSFISMTTGLPFLFFRLISVSVAIIKRLPVKKGLDKERKWLTQCRETSSTCKSLFAMFRIKWKYYRLLLLIYRLVIISTAVWLDKQSIIALYVFAGVQAVMLLISIYSRPYLRVYEDILSTLCFFINGVNTGVLIAKNYGVDIPDWLAYMVAVLSAVLPIIATFFSIYAEFKDSKAEAEKERQRENLIRSEERRLEQRRKETAMRQMLGVKDSANRSKNSRGSGGSNQKLGFGADSSQATMVSRPNNFSIRSEPTFEFSTANNFDTMRTGMPLLQDKGKNSRGSQDNFIERKDANDEEDAEEERIRLEIEKEIAARKRRVEILGVIKTMDQELDTRLMSTLVNFMLFSGLAAFLSVALIVIGVMMQIYTPFYFPPAESVSISSKESESTVKQIRLLYEFTGYSDWAQFTSKCCCQHLMTSEQVDRAQEVIEKWKCLASDNISVKEKFTYKERVRARDGNKMGLELRSYCSTSFSSSYVQMDARGKPLFAFRDNRYVVQLIENESNRNNDALQEASKRFW